ncbi:hypothetical protein [Spirosoma luteum]|uniref:hypothetical protein n=1 Tax=Spirosoma luteum TaxID=431553 RepID=UPI000380B556|nr:hypothetical protein [Spirosoma luteum]
MIQDDGSNAPLIHQHTIARLTAKLYPYFEPGMIPFEPIPEMMVGEYNSPTPDVILSDYTTGQAHISIEVTQTKGVKADLRKIINWPCFGDGGLSIESSFSERLQLDLNALL